MGKRQAKLKKEASQHNDIRKEMERELFDGRDFARSYGLDSYLIHRLREGFRSFYHKTGIAQCRMNAGTEVADYFCTYGIPFGTILAGAVLVSVNRMTLGAMVGGYLMIPSLRQCFSYMKEWVTERNTEKKLLERLSFFYEAKEEEKIEETEETVIKLHSLDGDKITFQYPGMDGWILTDKDFHMTEKENVRLIGENGSGKTTLLSILAGLYQPQAGTVCEGASVHQLRQSVALQEQNGTIFSGTIWENLFLSEEKRKEAADLLQKMGLEKPLNYEVAAKGANLSPGEVKKILLTRALLRDAPFLCLDEPLNHLDDQGKRVLLEKMKQRKGGILLVSHQEFPGEGLHLKTYQV
jgi:ABC-type bacteriocin/lantibiotic exporter with double-glycine peptidase domain